MKNYFFSLLLMLSGQHIYCQQQDLAADSAKQLNEVVITYQADKFTPVSFQNVIASQIKLKSVGQEPSFLLAELPSITVYSDAGSSQGYSYFRIRGIDQTRINITLDGVPLNEPEDQGAYFSNYPDILNSVSKVQVQRGVGTSKNGVASYGGAVELFSPNLKDTLRTALGINCGSFNSFRIFAEHQTGIQKNKALYIRASQVYSDGYKYNSSNNSQSVFLSGGLFLDKSIWKINFLMGHQRNQLAWLGVKDSLINIDRRANANKNERDQFTQALLQLQNIWQATAHSSLQSSIYYTHLNGNYDFNLNNFLDLPTTNELYNYAFSSNLIGFFSNYSINKERFDFTVGAHGNVYNRQHTGSELSLGKLYTNTGFKKEASTFLKADYDIQKLKLFADLQFRYASFDYQGDVPFRELSWFFLNPKVGVSYALNQFSTLYYSVGKTGREPTRNDMFAGNDNLQADSVRNALLKINSPEYVINHELGLRHQTNKNSISANIYFMSFENEIVLDGKLGPNGLPLTNKVEQSIRTGLEVSFSHHVNHNIVLTNNSSFNYSRIEENKQQFTPILTPPLIVNQEVTCLFGRLSASLSARYQHQSFIDFANTANVSSYFLMNSRLSYQTKGMNITLFLNNLTDTKYFNNGYVDVDGSKKYFVQAPTHFFISIRWNF